MRRRWLTLTGTSSLTGSTASSSEISFAHSQCRPHADINSRRAGWSSRRSFSSSELIGKRKVAKATAAIGAVRVWKDTRLSSSPSTAAAAASNHVTATMTTDPSDVTLHQAVVTREQTARHPIEPRCLQSAGVRTMLMVVDDAMTSSTSSCTPRRRSMSADDSEELVDVPDTTLKSARTTSMPRLDERKSSWT